MSRVPLRSLTAEHVQHWLESPPTFRYWGRHQPTAADRVPIVLNDAPEAAVDDTGTARLRLYDPIDSWGGFWGVSAKEFASVLDALPSGVKQIELRVNSPGGEVFDAIAIMNMLRSYDAPVRAVVDGIAASAASFIAASADETVMGPNSELMIHDAMGIALGNAADMHKFGDVLDHISNNIASVYASKTGGKTADWRATMVEEAWYNADEAVAAGLADSVGNTEVAGDAVPVEGQDAADPASEDAAAAEDRFDLAALFEHNGRKDAPAPPVPQASEPTSGPELNREQRHRYNARRVEVPA
jgi:ATP-dependent protease ClpP protease subunit